MANSRTRMGRPSRGDRAVLYTRVPRGVFESIELESERTGVPMSDIAANILADHFGVSRVAPGANPRFSQEELELRQAS